MYLTIGKAVIQGTKILEAAGVEAPRLNAEVLLAHALKVDRSYLFAHPEERLSQNAWIHYGRYLHQRSERVPTQYITGIQEFYGREFRVAPGALIPRPETEHLIEVVLQRVPGAKRILDLGCGSGIIGITLSLELRRLVFASDCSEAALNIAAGNARRLDAAVRFVRGDFLEPFTAVCLDAIVSNPPYVPARDRDSLAPEVRLHEPPEALYAGDDGLDSFRRLAAEAPRVLRRGGWLIAEIGFGQENRIRQIFQQGWKQVSFTPDLAGIARILSARLP